MQTKWEPPILGGELDTCQAKKWKYTLPTSRKGHLEEPLRGEDHGSVEDVRRKFLPVVLQQILLPAGVVLQTLVAEVDAEKRKRSYI